MTPTLIVSCAGAVVTAAARTIAASVVVLANCFMFLLRHTNGAGRRSSDYSMFRSCPTTCGVMDLSNSARERWRTSRHSQPTSDLSEFGRWRRASFRLQPGNDLAGNELDLLRLVFVGNEDDLLRSHGYVRLELLDAFVDGSHDGAVLCRVAPSREIPFLGEPLHHPALDRLAGLADVDRQLRSIEKLVRILSPLLRKCSNLVPRFGEAVRPVEIGEPTVAADGRAFEHAIDISADQDRGMWFLHRLRIHDAGGNVVAAELAAHRMLGPEAFEDVEIFIHDLAALLERHADGVEFAPIPARCHAHQQP